MDDPRNPSSSPLPGAPLSSSQPPRLPTAQAGPLSPQGPINPPRPINPPLPPSPPARPIGGPIQSGGIPVPDLRFLDQKLDTPPGPKPAVSPSIVPPSAPRPLSTTPPTARPAPAPIPSAMPPRPSVPPAPMSPPRPPVPPTAAPPVPAQEFKTSIRTLGSDLEKVKVGQVPSGLDIQKIITPSAPPPLSVPAPTRPSTAPRPFSVALGEAQRTPGIPSAPRTTSPRQLETPSDVTIAETPPRRSRTAFYLTIFLLLLLGGGAYYYFSLPPQPIVETSPSPSPRVSPSPVIKTLDSIFAGASEFVVLASSGNPVLGFQQKIRTLALSGGQFKKLSIQSSSKGAQELTPVEVFDRFLVTYPSELKNYLGNDTVVVAFGQREKFNTTGQLIANTLIEPRLVFISEVTNTASASATIVRWEPTMTQALAGLFGHSSAKAATPAFLNNTYQGTAIRYRNFKFPDQTIDYAVINASNGKTYFAISNSRESAFSAFDALKR